MDKDYILSVLRDCSDEFVLAPHTISGRKLLRKERFERFSYESWAVEEILKKIEESERPPEIALEELVDSVRTHTFHSEQTERIFLILSDTAEWMLDIVRAMR